MDSSGSHSPDGETVALHNLMCHGENLFIQVETTAPPPKRRSRRKRYFRFVLTVVSDMLVMFYDMLD